MILSTALLNVRNTVPTSNLVQSERRSGPTLLSVVVFLCLDPLVLDLPYSSCGSPAASLLDCASLEPSGSVLLLLGSGGAGTSVPSSSCPNARSASAPMSFPSISCACSWAVSLS